MWCRRVLIVLSIALLLSKPVRASNNAPSSRIRGELKNVRPIPLVVLLRIPEEFVDYVYVTRADTRAPSANIGVGQSLAELYRRNLSLIFRKVIVDLKTVESESYDLVLTPQVPIVSAEISAPRRYMGAPAGAPVFFVYVFDVTVAVQQRMNFESADGSVSFSLDASSVQGEEAESRNDQMPLADVLGRAATKAEEIGFIDLAKQIRTDTRLQTAPVAAARPSPPAALPAKLSAKLSWEGEKPFGDGALDAEESGKLVLEITNDGEGPAAGVAASVKPSRIAGVSFPTSSTIASIAPGKTSSVEIAFSAALDVAEGKNDLTIKITESAGHDANSVTFPLYTRPVVPPSLTVLDDFDVSGNFQGRPVPRDMVATVKLRVRNAGPGAARGVVARVTPGKEITPANGAIDRFEIGNLAPGETREIEYRCYANQRAETMALQVDLNEARPRFNVPGSKVIVPLEGTTKEAQVVRFSPDERKAVEIAAPLAAFTSDVDKEIPSSKTKRPSGLAVVFGVEEYAGSPPASYASNDAVTAKAYFEKLLGIPFERILMLRNKEATLGQFAKVFGDDGWLARKLEPDTEIFVFFSGHGMPEIEQKSAYLIPSDGDINYVRTTGYPIDTLLTRLGALGALHATVFLDACFSGSNRQGDSLLAGARPIGVTADIARSSKVSVFAAAKGTQIASSLEAQRHGVFSYYLFKGLGGEADLDGDGRVTTNELKLYLEKQVTKAAAAFDRAQTPDIRLEDTSTGTVLSAPGRRR